MKKTIIIINLISLLIEVNCNCITIDPSKNIQSVFSKIYLFHCKSINCEICEVCTDNEPKCLSCEAGYYISEKTKKCYKNKEDINNMNEDILEGCHPNCLTCGSTFENNTICLSCKENYYKINGTNICFDNSLLNEGFYLKDDLFYPCDENCLTCSGGKDEISNNCLSCDSEYSGLYLLEDKNNCEYTNVSGYYFHEDSKMLKKCYKSCKTCYGPFKFDTYSNIEDHDCIECADNYYKLINGSFPNNCYDINIINETNFSINVLSSIAKYPEMIENNTDNIEYNIKDIKNQILNYEKNEKDKLRKEEQIKYYDEILENIETLFTSELYNTSDVDSGKDEIIKTEKLIITMTSTQNQRNNLNINTTKIDLGECETLLRKFYNLSNNEILYVKKIDVFQEGMKTLKVEYEVYSKLFGKNLIKLNLTVCEKSEISISIPIIITENLDKFNTSNGYYNDICYTTTSEDGTDITLKDRQKEFVSKDYIICQEDCSFSEYDNNACFAKCSCKVKEAHKSLADMEINKEKLLSNFKNIKNIVNFNFLICYHKLFNKESLINNIGSYLIFATILFNIISIFICTIKQFPLIKGEINNIISGMYGFQPIQEKVKKHKKHKKEKKKDFERNKQLIHKKNNKQKDSRKKLSIYNKSIDESELKFNSKIKKKKKDKILKQNKFENIKNYIEEEINGLSYNIAIQFDKRTYCQYYGSLLKTQHNLISALFNNNDYNLGIIKIDLFFIGFTIEYTINALFYNDDTMHKIHQNKGQFNLENQIPIIIYSTLISYILNLPLNFLALSNDTIINFKQDNKVFINKAERAKNLINKLAIKFILFYIISFLFLLFFWYYISMFDVIYKNTQIHLLKDTLISFGLSLIIPFIIYLLPGLFRIPALSNNKKQKPYLYNFSKLLQLL